MKLMPPSQKERYYLAEIFVLIFILMVGGWTIVGHFDSEYVGYQNTGAWMLIGGGILAAESSAYACLRFSIGLSNKRSVLSLILLGLVALAIFVIGGVIVGPNR
jgi:hypothetical protein